MKAWNDRNDLSECQFYFPPCILPSGRRPRCMTGLETSLHGTVQVQWSPKLSSKRQQIVFTPPFDESRHDFRCFNKHTARERDWLADSPLDASRLAVLPVLRCEVVPLAANSPRIRPISVFVCLIPRGQGAKEGVRGLGSGAREDRKPSRTREQSRRPPQIHAGKHRLKPDPR